MIYIEIRAFALLHGNIIPLVPLYEQILFIESYPLILKELVLWNSYHN